MQLPAYVKFGIIGYGPDLDETDQPIDDVATLCEAIREELSIQIDRLAEEWSIAKASGDAEAYMAARELADAHDLIRANLDYARRAQAPLYVDDRDKLDATMLGMIEVGFPLVLDVDGNHALYVWTVSE